MRGRVFVVVSLAIAACSDDDVDGRADVEAVAGDTTADVAVDITDADAALPEHMLLSGTGEGADPDADRRVECHFEVGLQDFVPDGAGGWSAFASGEVFRTMFPDTRRFEFSAFIGGAATLTAVNGGGFELRFVGVQPEDAKPFWLALEAVPGAVTDDGWAGSFSCAPMDVDFGGYLDDGPTVVGAWSIVPAE